MKQDWNAFKVKCILATDFKAMYLPFLVYSADKARHSRKTYTLRVDGRGVRCNRCRSPIIFKGHISIDARKLRGSVIGVFIKGSTCMGIYRFGRVCLLREVYSMSCMMTSGEKASAAKPAKTRDTFY